MGLPFDKYDQLVELMRTILTGYTAPSYDVILAIEQAFIMEGMLNKKDREEIKKDRNAFLKQMELYVKQRIKSDLQI